MGTETEIRDNFSRFNAFWWGDKGLSALLGLLLFGFFLEPLTDTVLGRTVVSVFFTLLLVSGVANVSSRLFPRICSGLVAGVAIVLHWVRDSAPTRELSTWLLVFSLVYFLLLTWVVLHRAFRAGPVTPDRVRGAVAAYLLLAITWSLLYQLIELRIPGSFNLPPSNTFAGARDPQHYLTYFSFVTLTTLGYGDITPAHPTARMFVIIEALMGQLYPATMLARLVSLEITGRKSADRS